jgi:hypothetical protein
MIGGHWLFGLAIEPNRRSPRLFLSTGRRLRIVVKDKSLHDPDEEREADFSLLGTVCGIARAAALDEKTCSVMTE